MSNKATEEDMEFVADDDRGYARDEDEDKDSEEADDFEVTDEQAEQEEREANDEDKNDDYDRLDAEREPVLEPPALSVPRGRQSLLSDSSSARSDQSPKRKKPDPDANESSTTKKMNDILELTTSLPELVRKLQNEEFDANDPYYKAQIETLQRRKDLKNALSNYIAKEGSTNERMSEISTKVVNQLRELHKLMESFRDYHFKAFCGAEATRRIEASKKDKKYATLEGDCKRINSILLVSHIRIYSQEYGCPSSCID
jgi:hypothetical protein